MMLLRDPCPHAFSAKRLRRLRLLERALFTELPDTLPSLRTEDYAEILVAGGELENAGQAMTDAASRRLLERDLRDYAGWCDAFVPRPTGRGSGFEIDIHAERDAIRFFLGEAWLDEPLRPRLSSAIARALLLAQADGAELRFGYRAARRAGESWQAQHTCGQPLALMPGSDSAYLQLWNGEQLFRINLARILPPVIRTGRQLPAAPGSNHVVRYRLEFAQEEAARALVDHFHGLKRSGTRIEFALPETRAVMTLDRLAAYLWRTQDRPGERRHFALHGVTVVRLDPEENSSS